MRAVRWLVSLIRSWIKRGGCVGVFRTFATSTAEAGEAVAAAGETTAKAADAADEYRDDDYGGDDYADNDWPPVVGSISVVAPRDWWITYLQ